MNKCIYCIHFESITQKFARLNAITSEISEKPYNNNFGTCEKIRVSSSFDNQTAPTNSILGNSCTVGKDFCCIHFNPYK